LAYRMGPSGGMPPMVRQLILINAIVFLLTTLLDRETQNTIIKLFGLVPAYAVLKLMVWQFATYMFLHGGLMHILFNMLALWMFGSELERWWGSREFLKYYLITGIGAGVFNAIAMFALGGAGVPTIGASGAVLGILVAYAMAFPDRQILLWFVLPVSARTFAIGYAVLTVYMAVKNPVGGGVAHIAHLGGMLVGYLYLKQENLRWKYRRWMGSLHSSQTRRRDEPSGGDDAERAETMDRILAKISREGMNALTPEERRFLEEAGERARRKQRSGQ